MTAVARGRYTADLDPDEHSGLVLFHVGMRINRLRAPRTWLPVLLAMPRMLRELSARPELGLLSSEVFHETFAIGARGSETVYVDMPVMGMALATRHVPIARRGQAAAHRIDPATPDNPAIEVPE